MSFYIYNSAPGPMFFLGNEITAQPKQWTEVSEYAVNHGTFNAMKRMKFIYLVETDSPPTYDPTHPDNASKVEAQAPGNNSSINFKSDDGSMNADQLAAHLAEKNGGTVPAKAADVGTVKGKGKAEAITAESLAEIGLPPASPFEGTPAPVEGEAKASTIVAEELGETVPFVKEAKATKAKAAKAKAEKTDESATPQDLGSWS